MKKLSAIITLVLSLSLLLCSAASADTVTALATEINPEHLEKVASYAHILGYNKESNTLTVELIAPEIFSWEDVEFLEVGDSIYTDGREVVVETIEGYASKGSYSINDGEVILIHYFSTHDGFHPDYAAVYEDDDVHVWNNLGIRQFPVQDTLLFLDYTSDETNFPLEMPVVRTAREFIARLTQEDASEAFGVGFTADNVYVVFDGEGNLAVILRYYVPWQ